MSPYYSQLLLGGMLSFAAAVVVGITIYSYRYRSLNYPDVPVWLKQVRLQDPIEVVHEKIQPGLLDGFEIRQQERDRVVIEKTFVNPNCRMRFEAIRNPRSCWQSTSVKCLDHKWMDWSQSTGWSGWPIGKIFRRQSS